MGVSFVLRHVEAGADTSRVVETDLRDLKKKKQTYVIVVLFYFWFSSQL